MERKIICKSTDKKIAYTVSVRVSTVKSSKIIEFYTTYEFDKLTVTESNNFVHQSIADITKLKNFECNYNVTEVLKNKL
jgi:hypothetical protein